jgi:hypothetical protein
LQDPWYASPALWSFGVTTVAFGAFALLLSLRWRGELRSSLLLGAVLLSALWAASAAWYLITGHAPMWRTAVSFDLLRLAALLGFLWLLLRGEAAALGRQPGRALPVFLALLTAASLWLGYPAADQPEPPGRSFLLPFSALLAFSITGLAMVEQLYRRTPDALRWNVRPLCLGLGALFGYDLVLFSDALLFRVLDEDLWVARGLAQTLVIPLLGAAAARNREWTFDVAVSRGVVLGSTALGVAAAYLLAIAALGYQVRLFGGKWGTTLATVLVFGALLLSAFAAASRTFRSKLRVMVAKNLLARRYDYREEWLKFTQLMTTATHGRSLQARCVLALGDLVETASGALWLLRDGSFRQVERIAQAAVDEPTAAHEDLPAFLRATGWVIDVAEARRDPARYRGLRLPTWLLSNPNAWLVVPLHTAEDLVGFVLLGRPRVALTLDWEVLDLLKTAGRQTAGYLAQAQATEALLEARKFESFNRMSAFVVHDLKNLVAQLSLMLKNAQRHGDNPEFRRDMLSTVDHVVGRMNQLMLQLRSGETPVDRPHAIDLAQIAERVRSVRAAGRSGLRVDAAAGVMALGHDDRLERVIGHLVQNAFDACVQSGITPQISLRVYRLDRAAVIEVEDNGPGMSAEFVRDRLFKPFSSTKTSGMGIGTYESQQYVTSIGGQIDVTSQPGCTRFRVSLRAVDASDLAMEAPS